MSEKDNNLKRLDGKRFPAAAVMRATALDQNTLTNYLSKSPLALCSESSGQGRSRSFCLIDVYQLSLLRVLTKLTGRVKWACEGLNWYLFEQAHINRLSKIKAEQGVDGIAAWFNYDDAEEQKAITEYKLSICQSVYSAPQPYSYRDIGKPYFLLSNDSSLEGKFSFLYT